MGEYNRHILQKKTRGRRIIFLISFLFLFSAYSFSQQQWIIYNSSNSGLKYTFIIDLAIDTNNYKWIATDSGLFRYNGQNWFLFDTTNSGLPVSRADLVTVDKTNNLWIYVFNKGLIRYDGINWIKYDSLAYDTISGGVKHISCISVDDYNNVWVGTGKGACKYSNGNWTVYNSTNSGLPYNLVSCIGFENHNKWIGTSLYGIAKFNDTNWVVYNSSNSGLPTNMIGSVYIDYLGFKWIGTAVGVARFNTSNNTWLLYNNNWPGLPVNWVRSMIVDQNNIKWFGTSGGGLAKFNDTILIIYGYPMTTYESIRKIIFDKYGNLWIATDNKLAVHNPNGIVGVEENQTTIPENYIILNCYPNPFNIQTKISVSLPKNTDFSLVIYDINGRKIQSIADGYYRQGRFEFDFNGKNLSSGIYLAVLKTEYGTKTSKLILQK